MRIVLDLQAIQYTANRRRGIGRYSLSLAAAMAKHPRGHEIIVLLNASMGQHIEAIRGRFDGLLPQTHIKTWDALLPAAAINSANAFRKRASEVLRIEVLRQLRPDIVHIASLIEGASEDVVATIPAAPKAFANAVTQYDLIPLAHQDMYLADPRMRHWYMEKIGHLRHADLLLGISQFSCEEAHQLLGIPLSNMANISGAADDIFQPLDDAESFRYELTNRYGLVGPFILYAGGFDARKNLDALIRAYAQLAPQVRHSRQLAIVGDAPEPERIALRATLDRLALGGHEVVLTGYVPDSDLVKLYNLCELYVFPSLQEGFGMPALEAMSSGAVVIGSNTSSLPEIIGHPEALFDPSKPGDIAKKMTQVLTDASLREALREHSRKQSLRFSWGESARRALCAFEAVAERHSAARSTAVAMTGRVKPHESIAFVPAYPSKILLRDMRVDAVYADDRDHDMFNAQPISKLATELQSYDRVVIELADHSYCAKTLALATQGPVDILLSDKTFGSVWRELATETEGRRLVVALLYRSGGYAALKTATEANFSADVLASNIAVESLSSLGRCQLFGDNGPNSVWGWRDRVRGLIEELCEREDSERAEKWDWHYAASAISSNLRVATSGPQWLVDISNLVVTDAGTGIQRVVRHILDELLNTQPPGYRVEPIYLDNDGVFRYARSYCNRRYFAGESLPADEPVEFTQDDFYLGLDLTAHLVPEHLELFRGLRNRGIKLCFIVYDLLPILRPDCFRPELLPMFRAWYESISEVADSVMCISRSVADEFETWLHQSRPLRERPLHIGYFHLGADMGPVTKNVAESGARVDSRLAHIVGGPTILMVGTIEPRKGHLQALGAFEELWRRGSNVNLLIVGQPGWLSASLIQMLRKHPQLGRKLFWFEKAGDDLLLAAYEQSSALLMASEGEGFGLPLIEAVRHGLPLITRDLPVFREIVGEAGYYFNGFTSEDLANALQSWLGLYERNADLQPHDVPWLTWSESSQQLTQTLQRETWTHSWMPGPKWRFHAYDYRFITRVGRLLRCGMETTAVAGLLLSGPGSPMPMGRYRLVISGGARSSSGSIQLNILSQGGSQMDGSHTLSSETMPSKGYLGEMHFTLDRDVDDLIIQINADAAADLWIEHIEIHRAL